MGTVPRSVRRACDSHSPLGNCHVKTRLQDIAEDLSRVLQEIGRGKVQNSSWLGFMAAGTIVDGRRVGATSSPKHL